MSQPRQHTVNRMEQLRGEVLDLARRAKLDSWNAYIEKLNFPPEFLPALATGRPELLKLATVQREWTPAECADLIKLIAGLMETNMALQEHARELAHLVDNWADQFNGLAAIGRQIEMFANFAHDDIVSDVEEANGTNSA